MEDGPIQRTEKQWLETEHLSFGYEGFALLKRKQHENPRPVCNAWIPSF